MAARLRPVLSRLPRGYGLAYRMLLGRIASTYRGDALLKERLGQRLRIFHDRRLGCYVLADVGDAGSRSHFVLGRYYETFVPLVIRACLEPAGTFLDVGANRGVHSMFAARYLTSGRVISFEPNPRTFQVLHAHMTMNGLINAEIHQIGLSDHSGTLSLNLFSDDAPSGCSFIDKGENAVMSTFDVPVRRLDEVLTVDRMSGSTLVKIDTEGFEHHVIRGMGRLLEHPRLAILTEIVDGWLRKAGSSSAALFEDLTGRGFRAFMPALRFRGLNETLLLEPIDRIPDRDDQFDLLFAKPGVIRAPR